MKYILSLFMLVCLFHNAPGQKSKDSKSGIIATRTTGMTKHEGYFTFYHDPKTDKILLEIDRFNEEFLYVYSLTAGLGSNDIGLDRNQLGGEKVVEFERHGTKIFLNEKNYWYRAVSDNHFERKAVEDAFAKAVIWAFEYVTEENNRVLVDATDFLLRDAHGVSRNLKSSKEGTYSLDKDRSAIYTERTRSFPMNSEFEAILTFKGTPSGQYLRSVAPDPENLTVRQHHSFVALPDDDYEPRKFDPRSGYYPASYFDYATPISEPIEKRFITRHRLKKKDTSAARSEAVEPIVYYLDPGTPEPIRSALLEGALWWNQAFEAAGYIDAFQVKMLPEDADPMDVRYNMINWVHRSTRGWSYGSSVTDPRTGEIIKGHVLLGSLRVRQDFLIAEALLAPYEDGTTVPPQMQELALARLRQLSAHEVGHTLGLNHSYASSTEGRASVMDYPHPLIKVKDGRIDLSDAYDDKIGAWDKISIRYGYTDFGVGTDTDAALEAIIQEGLSSGLTFLTDQDARPVDGAHPYAHLWDNGDDVISDLATLSEARRIAMNNFGEFNIRTGMPYATLEEVFVPLYYLHRYQVEAVVKIVGGLDYRFALRGDGQPVTDMIDPVTQQAALDAVLATLDPGFLEVPESILEIIPPRPIGYERGREFVDGRTGPTFDPVAAAASSAKHTLSLLLNPARLQRLISHNARKETQPSLQEVIDQLLNVTIKEYSDLPRLAEYERAVDNEVVMEMIRVASSKGTPPDVSAVLQWKLSALMSWMEEAEPADPLHSAHLERLHREIDRFLDDPLELNILPAPRIPDGSPIGQGLTDH